MGEEALTQQGARLCFDRRWRMEEGQNFEALQSAAQQEIDNLTVIVDANKVQSDKLVDDIVSLGELEAKVPSVWMECEAD